jgi:hypothetical protein
MRQDAALEEGVELVLDELRQVCASSVFGLSEERRGVLLHSDGTHCRPPVRVGMSIRAGAGGVYPPAVPGCLLVHGIWA